METMWSPTAVEGYRVWSVRHDRVEGLRAIWRTPRLEATCGDTRQPAPPPHIGGRCACGIYAAKRPEWLAERIPGLHRPFVAMGRVELTGRVIEHTNGYRAQRARVTELAVRTPNAVLRLESAVRIAELFAMPQSVLASPLASERYDGKSLVATFELA